MNSYKSPLINRRQFLRGAGAGIAMFQLAPSHLLGAAGRLGANGKVNIAGIGIGSRGGSDINDMAAEGHNLVALCDVDHTYAAKQFAKYPEAKPFTDFRVMFDKMNKEI